MSELTPRQTQQLIQNGRHHGQDHIPVYMFDIFAENGCDLCWMLTELDPSDPDLGYGLCDLADGQPRMGHVSLSTMEAVARALGKPVVTDPLFDPSYPISVYAEAARVAGFITTNPDDLDKAARRLKGPQ
ncbi:DUF2958 domain-containing protein [Larkinella harenae]